MQSQIDIKWRGIESRQTQLFTELHGEFAHLFHRVLDHHLRQTLFRRGCGAAESDRAAGLNL